MKKSSLLLAAGLLSLACVGPSPPPPVTGKKPLNAEPGVQYVGREACKSCHLGIYDSYVRTGMGRSFYPLTAETAVEAFTTDNEFHDAARGIRYRMEQRDGRFFQRESVLDASGREVAAEERELVWVVGSNNHGRAYVTLIDDKLFQAPICWYPQAARWDLCPGFEHQNDHFTREISSSCVFCHNGRMERVEGERNRFEPPFPHGIGCERCHGPGQLHVERWRAGGVPTGEADPTIVNPRRLAPRERIDVCFQCHLGDSKAERVPRSLNSHEQYRPGLPLSEVLIPFRFEQKTRHDFGLSAQADRLILSKCYLESRGKIECLTCHDPHVTVYREDRDPAFFRQRCLGCHEQESCSAPADERAATLPADDCVACHMRVAEPDDQRFTTFTDHWIRRDIHEPPDERTRYEIEPTIPEVFEALGRAERAYYRGRAHMLMNGKVPPSQRGAMWTQAERAFDEAIQAGFDGAEAWFFLGKTRIELGRRDAAAVALREAVARDPGHHDALFALGQTLGALGRPQEALRVFEGMLEQDPRDPMALSEAGRLYHATGKSDAALESYRRAVEFEPWNATLRLNLGMTLASIGRFDQAAREGEVAARLDPDALPIWEFYANVMQAAGRPADAEEGRRRLARLRAVDRPRD